MVFLASMKKTTIFLVLFLLCVGHQVLSQQEAFISFTSKNIEVILLHDVVDAKRVHVFELPEHIISPPQAFVRQLRLREELGVEKIDANRFSVRLPEKFPANHLQIELRYTLSPQALPSLQYIEGGRVCLFWGGNTVSEHVAWERDDNLLFFLPKSWYPEFLSLQLPNGGSFHGTQPNVWVDLDDNQFLSFENLSSEFDFCWRDSLHPEELSRTRIPVVAVQQIRPEFTFPIVYEFSKRTDYRLKRPFFEDQELPIKETIIAYVPESESELNTEEYEPGIVAFDQSYPNYIFGFFSQIAREDYEKIVQNESQDEQFLEAYRLSKELQGLAETEVLFRSMVDKGSLPGVSSEFAVIDLGYDRKRKAVSIKVSGHIEAEIGLKVRLVEHDTIIRISGTNSIYLPSDYTAIYALPVDYDLWSYQPLEFRQSDAQSWKMFYSEDGVMVRYWAYQQLLKSGSPHIRATAASIALDDEIGYFRGLALSIAEGIPVFAGDRLKEGLKRMLDEGNLDQMNRAATQLDRLFGIKSDIPSFSYVSPNDLAGRQRLYSHWITRYMGDTDLVKSEILQEAKKHKEIREDLELFYFFLTGKQLE